MNTLFPLTFVVPLLVLLGCGYMKSAEEIKPVVSLIAIAIIVNTALEMFLHIK